MSTPIETIERIRVQRDANRQRRADIVRTIADLHQEQQDLEAADRELQIAERVVTALLPSEQVKTLADAVGNVVSSLEFESKPKRKPDGIPPILEMANEALASFEAIGKPCASCPEITDFIRRTWWPDVKSEFVSPQLWRAANRGDLDKVGNNYARKVKIEKGPATEVARPSLSNGETGSYPV
ncbi:hypothetical protein [Hyphomicrobium sp. DMF-1]|jgi:hypothetical protein|uniref:hypothetical protein n=1 Tax=Hyphomicrobium sp. DMF-1 TaxID=3019544 RepID=UPI0022EBBC55|nr:hypothetical protein [Hyphomicrobium sp. DMF-1]WBT39072.1 hypothetical protein PE058_04130 [Hyphomicrobium sp. DMF-1]